MSANPHCFETAAPEPQHPHPHSHGGKAPKLASTRRTRIIAGITTAVLALITLLGLVALWPRGAAPEGNFTLGDVKYLHGQVLDVSNKCPSLYPKPCQTVTVGIKDGPDAGQITDIYAQGAITKSGIQVDDTLLLAAQKIQQGSVAPAAPAQDSTDAAASGDTAGAEATAEAVGADAAASGDSAAASSESELTYTYGLSGIDRNIPLALLAILFIIVVVVVGRLRGTLALAALALSSAVILAFILPAIVRGENGLLVCLVGALAIMFPTLYFVHGFNLRTTAALFGTVAGALLITIISVVAAWACRMSGIADDTASSLASSLTQVDFRGLLTGAILISGLGILNDVTITQASAVWELRAAAPRMERREVFQSAMRIGRDHIASSVYTIFFAYVGGAIAILLALYLYNKPVLETLTQEDITIEVVSTLCGAIGLVLSVPITTALAVWFAGSPLVQKQLADN